MRLYIQIFCILLLCFLFSCKQEKSRVIEDFNKDWKFKPGDDTSWSKTETDDSGWRILNLPHDWSIEGEFSEDNLTQTDGGALPAGIGWYRKIFSLPESSKNKKVFIDFDGVYRNSEVYINGKLIGKRPNGYISFRYDLTPFLEFGKDAKNLIAVRVDNSEQPNSRWYTGSGIYRNVRLITTGKVFVNHWGTFITTPSVSEIRAKVHLEIELKNETKKPVSVSVKTSVYDETGDLVTVSEKGGITMNDSTMHVMQDFDINNPDFWSTDFPYLYKALTEVMVNGNITDTYETLFGIRYFSFNPQKGFFLNGKPLKILGVNNHHDLGALGAAVNTRAIERQLEILKEMGCNAIRTAHNPPAPELLDLCDKMGFLVMDEAFDVWRKKKMKKDYHLDWEEWHERDLADMVKRDRNHPSIIIWSIGNEIREQFDSTGIEIAKELVSIVKMLDTTRLVTSALTENNPSKNYIYQSKALDILGFNYKQEAYPLFPDSFPGELFIAAENMSALATRGHYDMPSDSTRHWPEGHKIPIKNPNPDFTVSAYDNVSAYWGSTHEETWKMIKNHEFIPGLFIWSGFDFIGEPVPYSWPARSSYYGIIDLAGFPKDAYYMYQSEWTEEPVLHLFPHWNWKPGETIDVWAYYNNADEVELFLNDSSLGVKSKEKDVFHVWWRVKFKPGVIKAVSRKNGQTVLEKEIHTASEPTRIELTADRNSIKADGYDLLFITVKITDNNGILVPDAGNFVNFTVSGEGVIAGVDNGYQASHEPFKANYRKAFNGMCLLIVQATETPGQISIEATSGRLEKASMQVNSE